jgi:ribonuclease P protein subunit POP4
VRPAMRNILQRELIGLEALVVNSSDPNLIGVSGRIIDETRGTLVIKGKKEKTYIIPKDTSIFKIISADGKEVEVDGIKLVARPEDRIKKRG